MTTDIGPRDIPIHQGPVHGRLLNAFNKAEAEWLGVVIIRCAAVAGNDWRTLTLDEVWDGIKAADEEDQLVRARIIDPLVGAEVLEAKGWIRRDADAGTLDVEPEFVRRAYLAAWGLRRTLKRFFWLLEWTLAQRGDGIMPPLP